MQLRPALVAGLLLITLGLAGCGADAAPAGTPTPSPPPESTASPDATFAPDATPSVDGSATPAPTLSGSSDLGDGSVASGEGTIGQGRVRLTVTELRRTGSTVILNATVTRVDSGAGALAIGDVFGDGQGDDGDTRDAFDGVSLVDPVGRRKYLVVRDEDGACLCSDGLDTATVDRGLPLNLQATLTAPPQGVTQVSLVIPGIRTFAGVAIED